MKIYISGISGTGMGPLALMAKNAGFDVTGSDRAAGAVLGELEKNGINIEIGEQDGSFLQQTYDNGGVDWFVYTSALPADHTELKLAQKLGIKYSKRDELISYLIDKLGLKLVAVAGTHGKTTTTSMIVWTCLQLNIPASYLVGTTLPFADAGHYEPGAEYLIYEADEYDRNFLYFNPWLAAITTITYDHPDIYPTESDYRQAFAQFAKQSEQVIYGGPVDGRINLAGEARRIDASLALEVIRRMADVDEDKIVAALNNFPGSGRRFERIIDGVYSDYGHHPEEIAATVAMAQEESERLGLKGVVVVYEPHQNTRQYSVRDGYKNAFDQADKVLWLPTYLTRENPDLPVLTPNDFIQDLAYPEQAEPAEMNDALVAKLKDYREQGYLVLLMTAGPADLWLRGIFGLADTK